MNKTSKFKKMVAGKSGVKSLGLVVILTVMLLCGVAEADGKSYINCYDACIKPWFCKIDPVCLAACAIKCAADCAGSNHNVLQNIGIMRFEPNATRFLFYILELC